MTPVGSALPPRSPIAVDAQRPCSACGYPRTGLDHLSPCPECGAESIYGLATLRGVERSSETLAIAAPLLLAAVCTAALVIVITGRGADSAALVVAGLLGLGVVTLAAIGRMGAAETDVSWTIGDAGLTIDRPSGAILVRWSSMTAVACEPTSARNATIIIDGDRSAGASARLTCRLSAADGETFARRLLARVDSAASERTRTAFERIGAAGIHLSPYDGVLTSVLARCTCCNAVRAMRESQRPCPGCGSAGWPETWHVAPAGRLTWATAARPRNRSWQLVEPSVATIETVATARPMSTRRVTPYRVLSVAAALILWVWSAIVWSAGNLPLGGLVGLAIASVLIALASMLLAGCNGVIIVEPDRLVVLRPSLGLAVPWEDIHDLVVRRVVASVHIDVLGPHGVVATIHCTCGPFRARSLVHALEESRQRWRHARSLAAGGRSDDDHPALAAAQDLKRDRSAGGDERLKDLGRT